MQIETSGCYRLLKLFHPLQQQIRPQSDNFYINFLIISLIDSSEFKLIHVALYTSLDKNRPFLSFQRLFSSSILFYFLQKGEGDIRLTV